jgi:hypothetical protein
MTEAGARASGAYSTRVLKRVERHLDLTEGRMEQLDVWLRSRSNLDATP